MLDAYFRKIIDPPLSRLAQRALVAGLSANRVTVAGCLCGMICFLFLAQQAYAGALLFLALSRLCDGLDGAMARSDGKGATDRGGFIDIVCDFVFYAGFPFFFAVGRPDVALTAAFLIFSFMGTGSAFLAYGVMAAKRGLNHERNGKKSFFHLQGLAEGSETIIAFVLICLLPSHFTAIAVIFGIMCWITAAGRIRQGWRDFS